MFASIISSLFLLIGYSIFNISIKELALTSGSKESQIAFFAADTAMECALMWDLNPNGFAESIFGYWDVSDVFQDPVAINSVAPCLGADITNPAVGWLPTGWVVTPIADGVEIVFDVGPVGGPCASVVVTKEKVGVLPSTTRIESRGYNTCDITNPRRVERGIVFGY